MTPENREQLRGAVLTKIYRDEDYSTLRFLFYHYIFVVLLITFFFGSVFVVVAIAGNKGLGAAFNALLIFFILSVFVAFIQSIICLKVKSYIPHKIQLLRSVLVIDSDVRIPYSQCRWSKRTCFAFYGYFGTGLSRNGLLLYLPSRSVSHINRLLVPLSAEEKTRWIEKLQVSCEEIEPSYLRMFTIAMIPACAFLPALLGYGLVYLSLLPQSLFPFIAATSLMGGIFCGIISLSNLATPPSARFVPFLPFHKQIERYAGAFFVTIFGAAFPMAMWIPPGGAKGNVDLPYEILWCFILWGILMLMTGSLTNVLYRPKKKLRKANEFYHFDDR